MHAIKYNFNLFSVIIAIHILGYLHYLNSSAKNSQPTYNIIWYNSSYNSKPFGDLLGNIFIYNSTKILTYLTVVCCTN